MQKGHLQTDRSISTSLCSSLSRLLPLFWGFLLFIMCVLFPVWVDLVLSLPLRSTEVCLSIDLLFIDFIDLISEYAGRLFFIIPFCWSILGMKFRAVFDQDSMSLGAIQGECNKRFGLYWLKSPSWFRFGVVYGFIIFKFLFILQMAHVYGFDELFHLMSVFMIFTAFSAPNVDITVCNLFGPSLLFPDLLLTCGDSVFISFTCLHFFPFIHTFFFFLCHFLTLPLWTPEFNPLATSTFLMFSFPSSHASFFQKNEFFCCI